MKLKFYFCALFALNFFLLNAQTYVTGSQSGIWTKANSPYVLTGTVTVATGQTLIIQPGVEVQLKNYNYGIIVNGNFIAKGTVTDSIKFRGFGQTSTYNYGGYIYMNTSGKDTLDYISADSLGDNSTSYDAAIYILSTSVSITNSSISNSELSGIRIAASNIKPAISNNKFYGSPQPIVADPSSVSGISNCPDIGIYFNGGGGTGNSIISKPGINSYYANTGTLTVSAGSTLTIMPGVEIRMLKSNSYISIYGSLIAKGTITDSIRFIGKTDNSTSIKYGGPLFFYDASTDTLDYVAIDSMGANSSSGILGAVTIYTKGKVSVTNTNIRNAYQAGIYSNKAGIAPVISNVKIISATYPAYFTISSVKGITNCSNLQVYITGDDSSAVLSKIGTGSYYIPANLCTIKTGRSLVIQPGVQVNFNNYNYGFFITGKLIANGSSSDSIRFIGHGQTSTYNYGGYVYLDANSVDSLSYISIDSLGDANSGYGAIRVYTTNAIITKCTLRNSEDRGISIYGSGIWPQISFIKFSGIPKPIYAYPSSVGGISNCNNIAITLYGEGITADSSVIPMPGSNSHYLLSSGVVSGFQLSNYKKLVIQPGVDIRSNSSSQQISIYGTLIAKGTTTDSISFRRDTGIISDGGAGNIYLQNTSKDTLEYVSIQSMGFAAPALRVNSDTVSIYRCSITNSGTASNGVYLNVTKSPVFSECNIYNNLSGGIYSTSGKTIFFNCNIYGNGTGISNVSSTVTDTIDARNCWWGDTTGPKQTTTNPGGLGNSVSTKVLYKPWLKKPNPYNDLGVVALIAPASSCNLSSIEKVTISIKNYSNLPQSGFDVKYQIGAGTVVTENVGSLTILPDSVKTYTFSKKANLSKPATTYNIKTFTALATDTTINNDTLVSVVKNQKPDLGKDTTVYVCSAGSTVDLTKLYKTAGYTTVTWNAANAQAAGPGTYQLVVVNNTGCSDTAIATVSVQTVSTPVISASDNISNICPGVSVTLTSSIGDKYLWSTGDTTRSITITEAGTYTVRVITSAGCVSANSNSITVTYQTCAKPASPKTTKITATSALLKWGSVSCAVQYKIQYRLAGGIFSTITTSNADTSFKLKGLSPGSGYEWQVASVCDTTSKINSDYSKLQSFTTTTGFAFINDISSKTVNTLQADLFPNPATDVAFISIKNATGKVSVIVSDINGKELRRTDKAVSNIIPVPVKNFAAGNYLVRVMDEKNIVVLKLMKE